MSDTIGKELREALRHAAGQDGVTVGVEGDDVHAAVDAEAIERYGVGVRGLSVRPTAPIGDVGEAAERIARDVDVIDPLRVLEYDAPEGEAILRTAEPEATEEGVTYWEATVRPDGTSVHRYHKAHAEPERQPVVEPLTHRQVGDLADQIGDALKGSQG